MPFTRRNLLSVGAAVGAAVAGGAIRPGLAFEQDDGIDIVGGLIGQPVVASERLRLVLPPTFPNPATVPIDLEVDTAMTATDHVRRIRVFAPRNPIVEVMGFHFEPGLSVPKVSARIRLAGAQHVIAVAEMSDGELLMAKQFVEVVGDGCAGH